MILTLLLLMCISARNIHTYSSNQRHLEQGRNLIFRCLLSVLIVFTAGS